MWTLLFRQMEELIGMNLLEDSSTTNSHQLLMFFLKQVPLMVSELLISTVQCLGLITRSPNYLAR